MVADFMRQHIGLGEIARRPELLPQLVVEAQIDINLLVVRAIERPGARVGHAAGRIDLAGEQHDLGLGIILALRPETARSTNPRFP